MAAALGLQLLPGLRRAARSAVSARRVAASIAACALAASTRSRFIDASISRGTIGCRSTGIFGARGARSSDASACARAVATAVRAWSSSPSRRLASSSWAAAAWAARWSRSSSIGPMGDEGVHRGVLGRSGPLPRIRQRLSAAPRARPRSADPFVLPLQPARPPGAQRHRPPPPRPWPRPAGRRGPRRSPPPAPWPLHRLAPGSTDAKRRLVAPQLVQDCRRGARGRAPSIRREQVRGSRRFAGAGPPPGAHSSSTGGGGLPPPAARPRPRSPAGRRPSRRLGDGRQTHGRTVAERYRSTALPCPPNSLGEEHFPQVESLLVAHDTPFATPRRRRRPCVSTWKTWRRCRCRCGGRRTGRWWPTGARFRPGCTWPGCRVTGTGR